MNVTTSLSTAVGNDPYSASNPQKIRADLQSIEQALQSGDLDSAKSAYAQLQNDAPWLAKAANGQATSGNAPVSNFSALGTALQSGDVAGAQKAFAQLQQTMHGHRGHHHRSGGNDADGDADGSGQNIRSLAVALLGGDVTGAQTALSALQQGLPSSSSGSNAGTSTGRNPFQDIATALQSGDLSGAQTALAAFLQARGPQGGVSLYAPVGTLGLIGGSQSGGLIDATA